MQSSEIQPEERSQTERIDGEQSQAQDKTPRNDNSKEGESPQKFEVPLNRNTSELKNTQELSPDIQVKSSRSNANPIMQHSLQIPNTQATRSNRLLINSTRTEPSPRDSLGLLSPLSGISASTLQHSSRQVSFGKAPRFHDFQLSKEAFTELQLPSSIKTLGTSLGFGKKIVMSEIKTKELVSFPAPNQYSLRSSADNALRKKFSFGESRASVSKAWLPGQTMLPPELAKELPGPGDYDINRDGFGLPKTTMKLKGKMFNEYNSDNAPPPNYYTYKTDFVENRRYAKISLGYGQKYDFTKSNNRNPGPGTYHLPSIFDKYDRSRYQNNWKRAPPLTFEQA